VKKVIGTDVTPFRHENKPKTAAKVTKIFLAPKKFIKLHAYFGQYPGVL